MEVKPGYKQTVAGVIPEDWDVRMLGDLGGVVRGGSPRPAGHPRYFNGDFIPWLTVASLTNIPDNQLFVTETASKLTREGSQYSRTLQMGTLVLVNSGAKTLGVAKILALTCCANDGIAALVGQRDGEKRFLCYYLNSQTTRLREVVAAGNDQLNLNTGRIALIPVPFPGAREQRAIAEALGDVDALLASLDRLIAKKRDIKQAVMQQLLTGKTRLPGFSGEWRLTRLGDHLRFLRNGTNSRAELTTAGRVKYLHYGDIHGSGSVFVSPEQMPSLSAEKAASLDRLANGDLVFADASEDMDGVGKSVEISDTGRTEFVSGLHTIAIRFEKEVLADGFKAYLQHCPSFSRQLKRLAAGTKVYATTRAHVAGIEMPLPSCDEQVAISNVLSDIATEIEALEARRDKTHLLKQGMMQELLTGRTRLV